MNITNVHYRVGDGSLGWPEAAPFDGIIATAGAPDVPQTLLDQLTDRGRLVIPIGNQQEQTLIVAQRLADKTIKTPHFPCRFVKLIGQEAWPETKNRTE